MPIDGALLLGNEWINYEQDYYKVMVDEDGFYKIELSDLEALGLDLSQVEGRNLQLWHLGKEMAIERSTDGSLSNQDYVVFYGEKNRGALDEYLFLHDSLDVPLNPRYSLFSDTSTYFLTWNTSIEGRRIERKETDLSGVNIPPIPYVWYTEEIVFAEMSYKPFYGGESDFIRYSNFDIAEGFAKEISKKSEVQLPSKFVFGLGPDATFSARFGTNSLSHNQTLSFNNTALETFTGTSYQVFSGSYAIAPSTLQENNAVLIDAVSTNDKHLLSFVDLKYPRTLHADNQSIFTFEVPASSQVSYLEFEAFNASGDVLVYDQEAETYINTIQEEGLVKALIPAEHSGHTLILFNANDARPVESVQQRKFIDYSKEDPTYVFLTHPFFIGEVLDQYVSYRSGPDGGNHSVTVIDITQVVDQFGYGIPRHAQALKNFGEWMVKTYPKAEFFLLIGKGREYWEIRSNEGLNNPDRAKNWVHTYGAPGSDNLITSMGNSPQPRIATGRLATRSLEELNNYLQKLIEYESAYKAPQRKEDKYWQKKIIHLSGGGPTDQARISNYLKNMSDKIEKNQFAGDVTTFFKTSSDNLQNSVSDGILNLINEGSKIITFFGHSAVGTFDFSLEDPSVYDNDGKYPLLISLGCFAGNVHTAFPGLSEKFVFEPNGGSIAFMAASGTAYLDRQGVYGNRLYELLGTEMYGESLSKVFQRIAGENNMNTNPDTRTMFQQFTLHGDPAIKLSYEKGPDYIFDFNSFKTEPTIISTAGDINLIVDVLNLGKKQEDTTQLDLEFIHYLPNGEVFDTVRMKIEPPTNSRTISVRLKNPGVEGVGRNRVAGFIDGKNLIIELPDPAAELNNEIRNNTNENAFEFFILDNSIRPIYPENFSIVNDPDFQFVASTSNAFQGRETYLFEVDTTQLFNSPIKLRETVVKEGGTIEWDPDFNWVENTVYYWRVTPDSTSTVSGDYVWQGASFVYLPSSSPGWNQNHYYQFLADSIGSDMRFDENRQISYRNITNYVRVLNNTTIDAGERPIYFGNSFGPWGNMWIWEVSSPRRNVGIQVAVLQEERGYWINPANNGNNQGRAGSLNSRSFAVPQHSFATDTPEERKLLIDFLKDSIPDGYYVTIYSGQRNPNLSYHPEDWEADSQIAGTNLYEVLENEGVTQVRLLKERGSVPFAFMYRKGFNEVYRQAVAENTSEEIDIQWEFPRAGIEGIFTSTVIGPSRSWERLLWEEELIDEDSTFLEVYGINEDSSALLKTVRLNYEVDLSDINANDYPFIQLKLHSFDSKRSPAKLNFWRVLYQGIPEATFIVNSFQADTLDQGQELSFDFTIKNISSFDMDSILVNYAIIDKSNNELITSERKAALKASQSIESNYSFNTRDISGDHIFSVEINPNQDQIETYYFNNLGLKSFFVKADKTKPLLDVTFDGMRIMNGDYVSAEPEILIRLTDDNQYLLLDNPEDFELKIKRQEDNEFLTIPLDDPNIIFEAAENSDKNEAIIRYSPSFQDGQYTMEVNARDVSNNFSGLENRTVSFRVDTEANFSNVLNYPNPFSTSTQFVFMITGTQVPDDITIQIMTLSGKVVREIRQDELGPLHIGMNRTQFKWDGTDEFGSKLANGVYLYRVMTHMENEEIKHFETDVDQFFTKGFGKMVIMR